MKLSIKDTQKKSWNAINEPIDFNFVNTPSTTYALLWCGDFAWETPPEEYYKATGNLTTPMTMCDLCALVSDNVHYFSGNDATKTNVLNALSVGKDYRTLYICGFAHGGKTSAENSPLNDGIAWHRYAMVREDGVKGQGVSMYAYEVWNALQGSTSNIFFYQDCCYGSGWTHDLDATIIEPLYSRNAEVDDGSSFASQLMDLFKNSPYPRTTTVGSPQANLTILMSSTVDTGQGRYIKGGSTTYSEGFAMSYQWLRKFKYLGKKSYVATQNEKYTYPISNVRNDDYWSMSRVWVDCALREGLPVPTEQEIADALPTFAYVGKDLSKAMAWC